MNERIGTMVALLKDRINPALSDVVQRDGELLRTVCDQLGLETSRANLAQVATLLSVMNIPTHEEYPKTMYCEGKAPVVVANEDEAKALGDGWSDGSTEQALDQQGIVHKGPTLVQLAPAAEAV